MRAKILALALALIFLAVPVLADTETPAPAPPAPTGGKPAQAQPTPAPVPLSATEEETGEDAEEPEDEPDYLPDAEVYDDGEQIVLPQTHQELIDLVGEYRHILLVGLDARPGETTGRSDTMILLTLDAQNEVIKLTSFMRDLYVTIPGRGHNRLNAAWVFGGADLLLETLEYNFGVHVDDYVAIDFSMLAGVIDDMGGLTITVETDKQLRAINGVIKEDNVVLGLNVNDGLLTSTGTQVLTGKQAQAYARYRKYESDFTRTQRQREVVGLLIGKLGSLSVPQISALVAKYVDRASTNLTVGDLFALLPAALAMRDADIRQLRIPQDGAYASKTISGMAVLVPDLDGARRALEAFISG